MVPFFHFPSASLMMLTYYIHSVHGGTIRTRVDGQYANETIYCEAHEACNIFCQHESSCHLAQIYCAQGASCTVLCQQDTACANAVIHAESASSFELLDCATGSFTCRGMTIYFPPNENGVARASIIGADTGLSAGSLLSEPLQFYAIYGWKDVNISTLSTFTYQYHAGTMHCTRDYDVACDFSADEWKCADPEDTCNDPRIQSTISIVMMQTDIESQFAAAVNAGAILSTSHMLYIVIGALMFFLCLFGFILFYYMYYSTQLPSESSVDTNCPQNNNWSVKFNKFPIILRVASSTAAASTTSIPSLEPSPPNSKNEKKLSNVHIPSTEIEILNKYSEDTTTSTQSGDDLVILQYNPTNNALQCNPRSHPISVPNSNINNINLQQLQPPSYPSRITPHYRVSTSAASLSSDQAHNIHNIVGQHYLIPSVSYQASCESSGTAPPHIVYQAPSQQQMMHMLTMMNESNPPSLSSFVKNNENGEYVMNQQPIEPSAQSSDPDDSLCVPQRRVTLTSETSNFMKVPPPSSVLSAFTSATVSDTGAISENSRDHRSNYSHSDLNLKASDAVYID